ncbi:septal ring lytic transglycosylase RlpA family protein [Testudinibacter sp. TR-2022]|uniref:septal ring lytic transglycosylase RlpA family protein n=1 Tax=Testudinibacter sp. TR-2022 TaxID=2585029 RepID=UPI00111B90C3|nr:septal ring lytic transglycosylase RlpA family protein [Testudinibacter sp. TR-2022]TNH06838.1 septal ring lytic transglycosylase RlpA family protein [Pasteurellaceae bacterium Phil11]TNH25624.1 septal ring lytic transglycosylase RlpA family protein [Testudinibacter sp. TR-2022]TNH27047.1 septal ring lytic transglycosylase RlpA family protein [Testudinibacter sp. TR-2022]
MTFLKSTIYGCLMMFAIAINVQAATSTQNLFGVSGPKKLTATAQTAQSQTYKVKGKTYQTLNRDTSKEYSMTGTASFYASKFHGRKTSNGEIYNENLMTAAHKRLPIPSYVLVTNVKNGRQVVVRINDRGPFVGDRKIDLSKAAARELGMLAKGTAQVKMEVVHVDKNGKISGPGGEKLTELAKNKNLPLPQANQPMSIQLADNKPVNAKSQSQDRTSSAAVVASNGNKVRLSNETKLEYELQSVNLDSNAEAKALIAQLSMKNVNSEIIQDGSRFKVKFGPIASRESVNQLKTELVQNGQHDNILYSYNAK